MKTNIILKHRLYNQCLEYIENRLSVIQLAIHDATESGNDETKSSAGDKHETGRAMAQLEQEKSAKQLHEMLEVKKQFLKINPDQQSDNVSSGSIVITDKGNFYIAVAAGKLIVNNSIYFAVSSVSPIGAALIGNKAKQQITFNEKTYLILEII